MKDFKILMENDRKVLSAEVTKHLRSGWKLQGALEIFNDHPLDTSIKVIGGTGGAGKSGVGGKGGAANSQVVQQSHNRTVFVQTMTK